MSASSEQPSGGLPARKFRIKTNKAPFAIMMALFVVFALLIAGDVAQGGPPTLRYIRALPISAGAYKIIGPLMVLASLATAFYMAAKVVFVPRKKQFLVLEADAVRGPKSVFSSATVRIPYGEILSVLKTVDNKERSFEVRGSEGRVIKWAEIHFSDLNAFDDFLEALKQYAWRAGVDL
ncbi:MAG: hypothetical protein AAFN04_11335 [Pseudomonadota bacterium]